MTIYDLLLSAGFSKRLTGYIVAQAAHETGNFTSVIFKENNNLFGMKLAKLREKTAIGEAYGHAVYKNQEDSIKDYILYFKAQGLPLDFDSSDLFVEALYQRGYFEADIRAYKKAVAYFVKKYAI